MSMMFASPVSRNDSSETFSLWNQKLAAPDGGTGKPGPARVSAWRPKPRSALSRRPAPRKPHRGRPPWARPAPAAEAGSDPDLARCHGEDAAPEIDQRRGHRGPHPE